MQLRHGLIITTLIFLALGSQAQVLENNTKAATSAAVAQISEVAKEEIVDQKQLFKVEKIKITTATNPQISLKKYSIQKSSFT